MKPTSSEAIRSVARVIRQGFRVLDPTRTLAGRARYDLLAIGSRLTGDSLGLPIPPPELTFLVAGHYNVWKSLRGGAVAAKSIEQVLERNSLWLGDFQAILDFGCGSGRVIRNFQWLSGKIYGTDYNPVLLDFCQQNLPFAQYKNNGLEPPLDWDAESFDLIYALSVFTHLSESLQFAWLNELRRVLKPGGYLLFSVHGRRFLRFLSKEQRNQFLRGELVVLQPEVQGTNQCGAYHPERYVKDKLAKNWCLSDFIPGGAIGTGGQDYYLFQKPTEEELGKGVKEPAHRINRST